MGVTSQSRSSHHNTMKVLFAVKEKIQSRGHLPPDLKNPLEKENGTLPIVQFVILHTCGALEEHFNCLSDVSLHSDQNAFHGLFVIFQTHVLEHLQLDSVVKRFFWDSFNRFFFDNRGFFFRNIIDVNALGDVASRNRGKRLRRSGHFLGFFILRWLLVFNFDYNSERLTESHSLGSSHSKDGRVGSRKTRNVKHSRKIADVARLNFTNLKGIKSLSKDASVSLGKSRKNVSKPRFRANILLSIGEEHKFQASG